MLKQIRSLVQSEWSKLYSSQKGVTIVEYVIMIALVALAVAIASPNIRTSILNIFTSIGNQLTSLSGGAGS